jgi:predicted phage terminase large subunit-like protein
VANKLNNLSEHEQAALILREIAQQGSFAEYCIAIDPNYKLEWFHKVIAQRLEDGYKRLQRGESVRLMIFMPPRHGKSDQATQKFPSWVLGKDPTTPIMVSSYSDTLATDFGQSTRDIMQSDRYALMFNTRLRADAKAKGRWMTNKKGGYSAVGVGGALTGRGFKIGIVDDPFKNREEADSPVIRDSRHKWFQSTFYTRQEGNSMIIFILTRWHDDDLAGRVLKDAEDAKKNGEPYDKWEIIKFKAIATKDDKYRKEGDALWPNKFPIDRLRTIKTAVGPYEFSALYQQYPVDEENRKFKSEWFRYRTYEEVSTWATYNVMTIDPRGKDDIKLGNDYIGITINFVDKEGNWNIITYRQKLSAKDLIDLLFTNWQRYHLHKIALEDNQFTQGLMVSIHEEQRKRGVYPSVDLVKHGGVQKELRIEALVPRYAAGTIFHLSQGGINQCTDLEEELALFPKATNDDASDSLAYQTHIAHTPAQMTPRDRPKRSNFHV